MTKPEGQQAADREREIRAEAWIERAARRLDQEAALEAEIDSTVFSDEPTENMAEHVIAESDQQFMAALRDEWWRVYPGLATLEFELQMLMRDAPNRSEDYLFDQQYGTLKTIWTIGRETTE